jgi:type II secretory pathway pseudopilin PulG
MAKRSFTRIELIVVIVILAIGATVLAGMLLPCLQKARERTSLPCISNLKQIGTAIVIYRDQTERYPFGRIFDPENSKLIIGYINPRSALGPDGKGTNTIRDLKIFICPSQPKQAIGYQCIDGVPNEAQMDSQHAILRDFENNHGTSNKRSGFVLRGDMSVCYIDAKPGSLWIADPKAQPPLDENGARLGWRDNTAQ